jgi:hypothetical protein
VVQTAFKAIIIRSNSLDQHPFWKDTFKQTGLNLAFNEKFDQSKSSLDRGSESLILITIKKQKHTKHRKLVNEIDQVLFDCTFFQAKD